jgi:hypothetical protein
MEYRYERKRRDRALLGSSIADGGEILCFARLFPRASVAMESEKVEEHLFSLYLQLSDDAGF